jgi:hypothetical protein
MPKLIHVQYPICEYIADREGLSGTARRYFIACLVHSYGFGLPTRSGLPVGTQVAFVAVPVLLGAFELGKRGDMRSALVWFFWATISAAIVLLVRNRERDEAAPSREAEWQVYCTLFRPIILEQRPGLLDRNLACPAPEPRLFRPTMRDSAALLTYRSYETVAVGLLIGFAFTLLLRTQFPTLPLAVAAAVPAGITLLAFLSRLAWHRFALRWVTARVAESGTADSENDASIDGGRRDRG